MTAEPGRYQEGFTARTVLGVLFIAVVMVPGSLYLNLVAGTSLGGAAEWVTIILFVELARRSFTTLKRQEIYILYYVAAALIVSESGSFGPLWSQYLVQSSAAQSLGIAGDIPLWVAPPATSEAIQTRNLLHRDWLPALLLLAVGMVMARISWISLSYALFRITADVERLPFPLAPIAAEGATALAESSSGAEGWRWRVFSIGAVIGIAFGAVYVGVPAFTGALIGHPVQLLPIPWVDLTQRTEQVLPATAVGFTVSLGAVIAGLVLPYWVVIGTVTGALVVMVANPILYAWGFLPSWHPGMDTIQVMFANNVDFWLSFGIGTTLAVALVGIFATVRALRRAGLWSGKPVMPPPPGRGDVPIALAVGAFAIVTAGYILLCRHLVPGFPWLFFVFFGFVFTPLNSYINARMIGISGQFTGIPFVAEGTFILSGYKGAAIWFAPVPMQNYGGYVQRWKEVELSGTRFPSLIKAEAFMLPVILLSSILFWSLLWRLGPIPSPAYPYAQKMWHLQALNQCLWISGTQPQETMVATAQSVFLFEHGEWEEVTLPFSERVNVSDVLRDRNGGFWIGTSEGLVYMERNGHLGMVSLEPGSPPPAIRDLATGMDQRLIVACDTGIYVQENDRFRRIALGDARGVQPGADGDLWVITAVGLHRLTAAHVQDGKKQSLDDGEPAFHATVDACMVDRAGVLWVGARDGLWSFNGWEWQPDLALKPPIATLANGPGGTVLAADVCGIWQREDDAWRPVRVPGGIAGERIRRIDTVDDELWLCTETAIWRRMDARWACLSEGEGAPSEPVVALDAAAGKRWLLEAIKPPIVGTGLGLGLLLIVGMSWWGLPVMAVYGFIRSLGSIPHMVLPEIIGALLGRYYFRHLFGEEAWRRYTPVLAAGFACGMGLIGMASIAFVLAAKSVIAAPF